MEQAIVHGVRTALTEAKVTVTGVPNHPGTTAALFKIVAELDINLGLVTQNPARAPVGRTDIAFTLAKPDGPATLATLRAARARIGFHDVVLDSRVAVITLTGAGMRSDPAIAATFCEALARTGIHLEIVSIESNRISVVCDETCLDTAVHALCEVFEVPGRAPPPTPPPAGHRNPRPTPLPVQASSEVTTPATPTQQRRPAVAGRSFE